MSQIVRALPATLPAAVLLLMHLPEDGIETWPRSLQRDTALPVREVAEGASVTAGVVHAAVAGYHTLVERNGCFSLSMDARVQYVRPSADVLITSVADCWRERACVVILSGANADGARGLKHARTLGTHAIVQRVDEAMFATMPSAALQLAGADTIMSVDDIPDALLLWLKQ